MPDASAPLVIGNFALAVVASLAWAVGLLMAVPRYLAFRQRRDLWWALAFACLLVVGVGFAWKAWQWLTGDAVAAAVVWADLVRVFAFALASAAEVLAYRQRTDAFD